MKNLRNRLSTVSGSKWLTMGFSSAMLAAALTALLPKEARAADRVCWCANNYCQQTGGSYYMRWCCDGSGCGCTLFVVC